MMDENDLARRNLIYIAEKIGAALTHYYHAVGQFT